MVRPKPVEASSSLSVDLFQLKVTLPYNKDSVLGDNTLFFMEARWRHVKLNRLILLRYDFRKSTKETLSLSRFGWESLRAITYIA